MSESPRSRNAQYYDDLWAAQWSAVAAHSPLRAARERLMLAELRPRLAAGASLLDVGSGDGRFISILRQRYPAMSAEGVDFSAAARLSALAEVQSLITVGDVSDLRSIFPVRRFDLITCSEVLEHVQSPLAVIEGVASLLADDGLSVITVPGGMRYWSALDESAGHLRRFEYDDIPKLVERAGLRVVKHFSWGAAFGRIYYRLVRSIGPDRAASSAHSSLGAFLGRTTGLLLRMDDYVPSRNGFQLVTVVSHA